MRNTGLNGMKRNAQKDIVRCICDFNPGIGDSICCDKCFVWQHMRCMGVHPNKVPKIYECDKCNPRPLDKEAAVQLQLLLQEESSSSDDEEDRAQAAVPRKSNNPKRSRKASSTSIKSEESSADIDDRSDCRRTYKEVKENMYSPSIKHRLEPRTEGLPSFGGSPPGVQRVQPQAAGYTSPRIQYPAPLHLLNHGPSKIVVTKHTLKLGAFISDFMGHFKQLSEYFEEVGGKSTLYKRPMNYVLHYPLLDICVDTREYGNIARFMRRSCHPNAHAKSYLQEGKLHIGIYAQELIAPNSEITIGFNFPVDHYQYTQTCSCSSSSCLVTKNNESLTVQATKKPFSRTNSMDSTHSEEAEHKKHRLSREEVKMQSYIQVIEKIERDEERKRVLSENLKSPTREPADPTEESGTPSRGNKSRRRKGSGKKGRRASGSSAAGNNASTTIAIATTIAPEHFTFEQDGAVKSCNSSPANSPRVPKPTIPAYTITEPILTQHHVRCNGYEADIQLRPISTAPTSRTRHNFQLKNSTSHITPIKVQRDGFIVPIHGSLINCKPKNNIAVYKTSKKRWLETFIQEGGSKCMSPAVSPRHLYSPTRENITPEKEMSSPASQVALKDTEGLEAATRTLNLSDDTLPSIDTTPTDQMDVTIPPPSMPSTIEFESSAHTSLVSSESCPANLSTIESNSVANTVTMEKKKRVSLADYRKRLQSRSSKTPSTPSETECKIEPVSPKPRPVFEPISPVPPESAASPQSSLLEEFSRPSLSETLSDESSHPSKIRKIDYSSSPSDKVSSEVQSSDSTEKPVNGAPHSYESPSHALSHDTFSKIKEILSQSNPGLMPSRNLNVSSLKTNLTMYDPNGSTVKQYHQFPGQYSEEMYSRDTKRLKPSVGHSEYPTKYYKESDKR
ncbi:histone-lysine N-methyltransferase set-26-like isoform X3 [Bolinopsis microptera]|uniref:histone-lysine N-methyltransferase set-26-like isoform X3 n=1 Tax=Bolinopsis microptera TaxID=2820187 RepID=UPI00307ACFF1